MSKKSPSHETGSTPEQESQNKGSVAFFALFILPLAIALTAVAVDVSAWFSLREEAQAYADRLALRAAEYLPDQKRAAAAVHASIPPPTLAAASRSVAFRTGTSLTIETRVRLQSSGTITRSLPGLSERFSIERRAVAQVVPVDFVFIVAGGRSLRPATRVADEVWGDPREWPASGYFQCAGPPRLASRPQTGEAAGRRWLDPEFQRFTTKACFNPIFSALKLGVISLLDEISRTSENRVAFFFTPGDNPREAFSVLKHLRRDEETRNASTMWTGYADPDGILSDEVCMLFSECEGERRSRYALPLPQGSSEPPSCCERLVPPACGAPHQPTGHLHRCLLDQSISLREAVYWHEARDDGSPAILETIAAALAELRSTDLGQDTEQFQHSRGRLAAKAIRQLIVVTDEIPGFDEGAPRWRSLLESLRAEETKLFLVAYAHPGLSPMGQDALKRTAEELAGLEPELPIRTFLATSPMVLSQEVLPALLRIDRQIVLRE